MAVYTDVLRERVLALRREKKARDSGEDSGSSIPTGLTALDRHGGIERGVLTVIGAATGEGKSTFRQHLQECVAKRGLKALDLSFEDPVAKTADRTLAGITGINSSKFSSLDELELRRVRLALSEAESWSDNIEYHFGLQTPEECVKLVEESDADLVAVDYAQAFPEGDRGLERTIADFAWKMAVNAQQKNRAIVIYSQLRSEVEQRGMRLMEASKRRGDTRLDVSGFRPCGVVDLAWSTALGQRAKGLGFLFRPGRYRRRFGEADPDNEMELLFPKRNFGAEGSIVVGFDGKTSRLFDLKKEK